MVIEPWCLPSTRYSHNTRQYCAEHRYYWLATRSAVGINDGGQWLCSCRCEYNCPSPVGTLKTSYQTPQPAWDTRWGRRAFLGGGKFYIDSMYENNGYAYNLNLRIVECPTLFQGTSPPPWLRARTQMKNTSWMVQKIVLMFKAFDKPTSLIYI